MSSNPLRLRYLLRKYLNKACTRQDLKELWQLMSELSEEDEIDPELQQLWNAEEEKSNPSKEVNRDKLFIRLQQKMREQEFDYKRIIANRPRRLTQRRLAQRRITQIAIAASLSGCIFLSWWLINGRIRSRSSASAGLTVKKSAGHQVINLPDGTVVTLNHDSKLDYPAAFNSKTREVYLSGEAFFEVKGDVTKAFLVHTGRFVTRVLGTSFNIKAYSGDENISVTVTTGKVQVQRSDDKKPLGILLPGDQLVIGRPDFGGPDTGGPDNKAVLVKADLQKVLDWKKEDLAFDNITFDEAAVLIGNHYGVELRFQNEAIRNCRFTGNFGKESLEEVLDIIGDLTRTKWHRDNNKLIWIEGEGCR
jgi:ferric-dicitrate binding protein FerR (iron transport regulator)